MTNSIPTRQNEPTSIALLRAQRHLYGSGKRVAGAQALIAVGAPLFSVLASLTAPTLRPLAALTAILGIVLDALVLDRWQKALKKRAAKIQEAFDCTVLELPRNDFKVGSPGDPEEQHEADHAYLKGKPDPGLQNWYPAIVGSTSLHHARIICQRANLWWGARLRRGYANWLAGVVLVAATTALYAGLFHQLNMEQFVLWALAPMAPFLVWGIRELYRQREAADFLDRLKQQVEDLRQRVLKGACDVATCVNESRLVQDQIFDHRASSPLIFDWVYRLRRRRFEEQMNAAAETLVREANEKAGAG